MTVREKCAGSFNSGGGGVDGYQPRDFPSRTGTAANVSEYVLRDLICE